MNEKLCLFDIEVEIKNEFPECQDSCPNAINCANHKTANDWKNKLGATPDLKQVVEGSWRCHRNPQEMLRGAVLIDGTLLGDRVNGPIKWTTDEEIDKNDGIEDAPEN